MPFLGDWGKRLRAIESRWRSGSSSSETLPSWPLRQEHPREDQRQEAQPQEAQLRVEQPREEQQRKEQQRKEQRREEHLREQSLRWRSPVFSKSAIAQQCDHPECGRGPRSVGMRGARPYPRFDSLALCSLPCVRAAVASVLRREMSGAEQRDEPYRHRIPLGLLMLSRKWITRDQLSNALENQKAAGEGKLGDWLIRTQSVDEQIVANALAAQWGTPFLPLYATLDLRASSLLPRLFIDAFGVIPLRIAARKILYLAVTEQVDRCLNQAIEVMTGLTVEAGVMKPSEYRQARDAVLGLSAAPAKLFKSSSIESLESSIADRIFESEASWSCLVRVKQYIWLRVESPDRGLDGRGPAGERKMEDFIFTLPPARSAAV